MVGTSGCGRISAIIKPELIAIIVSALTLVSTIVSAAGFDYKATMRVKEQFA